eukprot:2222975-Prymnesium_polylepis.1
MAFSSAITIGSLGNLTALDLSCNDMHEAGVGSIWATIERGLLPRLERMDLGKGSAFGECFDDPF